MTRLPSFRAPRFDPRAGQLAADQGEGDGWARWRMRHEA
jgi:hypothetical protein